MPNHDNVLPDRSTIVSIILAQPGWFAIYRDRVDQSIEIAAPLAAWALVNDGRGNQFFDGVDPSAEGYQGDTCTAVDNFDRFEYRPT